MNGNSREEIEVKLIAKASEDADFKQALISNPHQAIAQFGVQVPKDVEVKVVEESSKVVYLVLPTQLKDGLSDEASCKTDCWFYCGDKKD